jgi:hydrogenase maturation protease
VSDRDGVVVIGVGNRLLRDDGVGVHVIEVLARQVDRDPTALPGGTRLVDGGTLGLGLLPDVETAGGLILVDAIDLGLAPGTVSILRGAAIDGAAGAPGPSQAGGVGELVSVARLMGVLPPEAALVGIQVAEIDTGLALSRTVGAALPAAVEATRREIQSMAGRVPAKAGTGVPAGATP